MLKHYCGRDADPGTRMVGSPDGLMTLSFAAGDLSMGAAVSALARMTPEELSKKSADTCKTVFHIPDNGLPCAIELGQVAGRQAVLGHVRKSEGGFEIMRAIAVPNGNRTAVFIFSTPLASKDSDDRINTIVASIRVSGPSK